MVSRGGGVQLLGQSSHTLVTKDASLSVPQEATLAASNND